MSEIPTAKTAAAPTGFTEGPISTHLIRLTGFMLLGFVSFMTASLIEAVYVGRVGTAELAAISFTFPFVMSIQGISMGLGIGAGSVVARAMGSGDRERVKRVVTHSFILVVILQLATSYIAWLYVEELFGLLGAEPHILALIVDYMDIWMIGSPFFAVAFIGSTLMRATGDAVTPGYLMAAGAGLQVVVQPFFIFGLGPVPEMGLGGAAVGFVVSRVIGLFMYMWFVAVRDRLLTSSLTGILTSWRDILHVGLPAVASNMITPVSMAIITRLLAGHGSEVVAGFGVASRIESMVMMMIFALSMSIAPFAGQNWGAGHVERVTDALRLSNRFCMAWGIAAFVVLFLAGAPLVGLINDDPKVIEVARIYLVIVPMGMGFMGVMNTATQTFNALGRPIPPLVISVMQTLVAYVPLALLGDHLFGYRGIFGAQALTAVLLGILATWWVYRTIRSESTRLGLVSGVVHAAD